MTLDNYEITEMNREDVELIDETSGKLTVHGKKHIESLIQECINKNYTLGAIEIYNRSHRFAKAYLDKHFKYGQYFLNLRTSKTYSKFFE